MRHLHHLPRRLRVPLLILLLTCAACAPRGGNRAAAPQPVPAGTAAPGRPAALALLPADAPALLAEARRPGARATLVHVWATWCLPCREEFPDLLRLERAWRARGLRVALVSADFDSSEARAFLARRGVDYPAFFKIGDDMRFIDTLDPGWSGALPATFVYDGRGRRVRSWEGRADYARFEGAVREAMNGGKAPAPAKGERP